VNRAQQRSVVSAVVAAGLPHVMRVPPLGTDIAERKARGQFAAPARIRGWIDTGPARCFRADLPRTEWKKNMETRLPVAGEPSSGNWRDKLKNKQQ
jgi:hypothetical protein